MSIKKMLLIAGMALAAVAFAVPAMAQAQEHGLTENGEFINATPEEPAEITATSEDLKTKTSLGTLECKKVTLHMLVTENTDEHVVVSPDKEAPEATTEECVTSETLFGTLPTTITDGTVEEFTVNTWGTAEAHSSFAADISVINSTCHLQGYVHLQAAENDGDILNIGPSELTKGPGNEGLCPEKGTMTGHFTLETADGTAITTDFAETE